jgi:dTDP-4-amino-4,6-dideoxygalactose transaminase
VPTPSRSVTASALASPPVADGDIATPRTATRGPAVYRPHTPATKIPFNHPFTTGEEFSYIGEAIENLHLSGNGPFADRCTHWLEDELGCQRALLTSSCTSALEMAMLLADIGVGDEVIMPSFTFVTSASSVAMRGAIPVFVDIREDTLNLDERRVEGAITSRTRAIMPMHYAGVACTMQDISAIAKRHGLIVIEDAAQGISASYRGNSLGTIGDLGCISFHETKNLICGEGGALLINRSDWVERGEIIQEKGTDRARFLRGQVDRYTWVDLGSSFLMSEINAAFLWAQIQHAEEILARRMAIWLAYHERLASLEEAAALRRPTIPVDRRHNAHMYYILLEDRDRRDRLIRILEMHNIYALFHYIPLHSAPAGERFGRVAEELPVTDRMSERLLRLPFWVEMSESDVDRVCSVIEEAL